MKNTKKIVSATMTALILIGGFGQVFSQAETDSDTAAHLDLQAIGELFKNSENVEAFERSLNSSDVGINNLDLNNDGEVDVISVAEETANDARLLILRVPTAENDFQDVATIAIEQEAGRYDMEIQGNADIYGANYYIVPVTVNPSGWRIFTWLFRPAYLPYRSVFGYRTFPLWWKPRRAVSISVYRVATGRFVKGRAFATATSRRIKTVSKIKYVPRTSKTIVVKKRVVTPNRNTTVVKKSVKVTTKPKKRG